MNCLTCKSRQPFPDDVTEIARCKQCHAEYFIIEGIPLLLSKENDFYRYKDKLARFLNNKFDE